MTGSDRPTSLRRGPVPLPRHELPVVDAAALEAARAVDAAIVAARAAGADRWVRHLAPLPDRLRDDPVPSLRAAARSARAAFGPKDDLRDVLGDEVTRPLMDALDRLLRELARAEARPSS